MDIHREIADQYQGLFNLMSNEHGLTLTISEMDEIINESKKVINKISSKPVLPESLPCDHLYSKSKYDPYPRRCDKCGEFE